MPKKLPSIVRALSPIHWTRAFICGAVAALMMASILDIFFMLGLQHFSLELFLGSLFTEDRFNDAGWTLGFFLNLFVGGVFGVLYAYFFEYTFRRASVTRGLLVAGIHLVAAAAFLLPFFHFAHEQMETGLYPDLGILGASLGIGTPISLIFGHLLFGATMGLFYGPVRAERARMTDWEPENTIAADLGPRHQAAGCTGESLTERL